MSSLTPQKLAAPSPQQPFLATPSPPRIRHAPGLSRYERDTAAAAAQEEAKRRQVTRRPPQDASARQNANQQAREGPNEQEARKASSRDDGIPGNKDGSVENKAVAARENPPVTHTWGDGMDVKQVGEWRLGRVIGKGTSGKVKIARSTSSGVYAACKIVPRHAFLLSTAPAQNSRDAFKAAERARTALEREVAIMKLVSAIKSKNSGQQGHAAIMKLYDVHEVRGVLLLLLEYVPGGELFDYLVSRGALPPHEASSYFAQTLSGLRFLHGLGIVHRDLKPENLLLDAHKRVRIADFGMASLMKPIEQPRDATKQMEVDFAEMTRDVELGEVKLLRTSCGSPHYAAPEVIEGYPYDGRPADLWSLGVILYALLCGRLPFDDPDVRRVLSKVRSGRYAMPRGVDHDGMRLVTGMLRLDPESRMTVAEISVYPFTRLHLTSFDPDISAPVADLPIPSMHDARYLKRVKDTIEINREAFASLKAIWGQIDEQRLVRKLISRGPCLEKMFYWILVGTDDDEEIMAPIRDALSSAHHHLLEPIQGHFKPTRRGAVRSPSFYDGLAAVAGTPTAASPNPPKTPPPREPLPQLPAVAAPKTPERRGAAGGDVTVVASLPRTPKTPRKISNRTQEQHSRRLLGSQEASSIGLIDQIQNEARSHRRIPLEDKTNVTPSRDRQSQPNKVTVEVGRLNKKTAASDSTAASNAANEASIVSSQPQPKRATSKMPDVLCDHKQDSGTLMPHASVTDRAMSSTTRQEDSDKSRDGQAPPRLRTKRSRSLISATTKRPALGKEGVGALVSEPKRSLDVIRVRQAQLQAKVAAVADDSSLEVIRDDDDMMQAVDKTPPNRLRSSSSPLIDSPLQSKSAWLAQFLHLKLITFTLLSPLGQRQTTALTEHILAQMQTGAAGQAFGATQVVLVGHYVHGTHSSQEIDCKVSVVAGQDTAKHSSQQAKVTSRLIHIRISFRKNTAASTSSSHQGSVATLPVLTRGKTPTPTPASTPGDKRQSGNRLSKDSPKLMSLLTMTKQNVVDHDAIRPKHQQTSRTSLFPSSSPSSTIATAASSALSSASSFVQVQLSPTPSSRITSATHGGSSDDHAGGGTAIAFTHLQQSPSHTGQEEGGSSGSASGSTGTSTRTTMKAFVLAFRGMWMSHQKD